MGNRKGTDRYASMGRPITIIMQPTLLLLNKKSDTVYQKKSRTVYQNNIRIT